MQDKEFDRVWNLLAGLWPLNIAKANRRVWQVGLAPYSMADCTGAIMDYARRNKLFPDLADVTAQLLPETPTETELDDLDARHVRDVIARFGSWEAYLDKLAGWIEELEAK